MPRRILHKLGLVVDKFKSAELTRLDNVLKARWIQFLGVALLSLLITMLATISPQIFPEEVEVGAIATRDIKADRNYEIVDEEATEGFKKEAAAAIPSVYRMNTEMAASISSRIESVFDWARKKYAQFLVGKGRRKKLKITVAEQDSFREEFGQRLGVILSDSEWDAFFADGFSSRTKMTLIDLVNRIMQRPILSEETVLNEDDRERGINIRRFKESGDEVVVDREWLVEDLTTVLSVDKLRERMLKDKTLEQTQRFSERNAKAIMELAASLILPNLTFEEKETTLRRTKAAEGVKSSIIKIKAGEMIIRNGARFEKWHIKVLKGIQTEKTSRAYSLEFFGTWLMVLLAIIVPYMLGRRFIYRFHPRRLDYVLMSLVGIVVLALIRIMMIMLPAIREAFLPQIPTMALNYLIPVAGGAMLLRMILNAEATLVFSIAASVVAGLLVQTDIQYTAYVMISSFAAMIAIAHVDRRSLIMRAGLIVGGINALIILGIRLLGMVTVTEAVSAMGLAWCMIFGFLGGIGCAIFVMVTVPVIESLMNYTTDIKLLELANLNHPLLRELIVSAPGTYHHSHIVGILGEAAAEAIGSNPLIVRVGAYYHDIGKMRKPPYFIENAKNGENRHEKLSPHMSALIVQSHVKDGIEMAQAERLPGVIIDMIPQHHGTRMISFFYEKAKSSEQPDIQKVDQKDFQYPGPKPQSREAAILMLADIVEAQVRSLKEKSPVRIEQIVRKIIDDVFREAQLDECELTLKDLDNIHKAFVRILLGIYHQRIEYPEREKGDKSRENLVDSSAREETPPESNEEGAESGGARKKYERKGD